MQDFDIVSLDGARGDEGFEQYRVWKRTMQNKLIIREGEVPESEEYSNKRRKENDEREDRRQRVKNADVERVITVAGNQFERARNTITREEKRLMKEKNTDRMRIGTLARSQISRVRNAT
jgi:hypothetical protein